MLTKSDLNQIDGVLTRRINDATRRIVQEETRRSIQEETPMIVGSMTRKIIQEETPKIVRNELVGVKKDIEHIRQDMKTNVNFFDREYLVL